MSKIKYKGCHFDSLAQVILSLMDELNSEVGYKDLAKRLLDYPLVSEAKIRRRLRHLEQTNVVNVREVYKQNVHDKKYYTLNRNGRNLIDEHDLDLPISLENRMDIEYLLEHAEVAEGYIRYMVDDLYNEQI